MRPVPARASTRLVRAGPRPALYIPIRRRRCAHDAPARAHCACTGCGDRQGRARKVAGQCPHALVLLRGGGRCAPSVRPSRADPRPPRHISPRPSKWTGISPRAGVRGDIDVSTSGHSHGAPRLRVHEHTTAAAHRFVPPARPATSRASRDVRTYEFRTGIAPDEVPTPNSSQGWSSRRHGRTLRAPSRVPPVCVRTTDVIARGAGRAVAGRKPRRTGGGVR